MLIFLLSLLLFGCVVQDSNPCGYEVNDRVEIKGTIIDTKVFVEEDGNVMPQTKVITVKTENCDIRVLKESIEYIDVIEDEATQVTKLCVEEVSGSVLFKGVYRPLILGGEILYHVMPSSCKKSSQDYDVIY